jgi:hypothetical protein
VNRIFVKSAVPVKIYYMQNNGNSLLSYLGKGNNNGNSNSNNNGNNQSGRKVSQNLNWFDTIIWIIYLIIMNVLRSKKHVEYFGVFFEGFNFKLFWIPT